MQVEETLECHDCAVVCEKVVYPAHCLDSGCRYVYAFCEEGRTFFGCIEKVYRHEIDLDLFHDIERTKGGFGVVKAARQPLAQCAVAVQTCYQCAEGLLCRNMYFRLRDRREIGTLDES